MFSVQFFAVPASGVQFGAISRLVGHDSILGGRTRRELSTDHEEITL